MAVAQITSTETLDINSVKTTDVKHDTGGGAFETGPLFTPPGFESVPMPQDYALVVTDQRTGGRVVAASLDPASQRELATGESLVYSRKEDGTTSASIKLETNGTIMASNDNITATLSEAGAATIVNENISAEVSESGAFTVENSAGHIKLLDNGTVEINGVRFDTSGNISNAKKIDAEDAELTSSVKADSGEFTSSLKVNSKELDGHQHTNGNPKTGPNL